VKGIKKPETLVSGFNYIKYECYFLTFAVASVLPFALLNKTNTALLGISAFFMVIFPR
jgi:hypothetical protein